MTVSQIIDWIVSHAPALWPVVSALLIIALRTRSPEEWIALGEQSPRAQGVIRLLRAVGLDPAKALSALAQIVTGRAPSRAVQIADTIAPVDPSKVPAPIQREGERGSARVGAVAFVLAVGLCLAGLGATLAGCPKVIREPALPPPPDGCDAGATLCHQGAPWRCGPGGHWSQADRRCDRLGAADASVVCCPSPSALRPSALVHACVSPTACSPEVSR